MQVLLQFIQVLLKQLILRMVFAATYVPLVVEEQGDKKHLVPMLWGIFLTISITTGIAIPLHGGDLKSKDFCPRLVFTVRFSSC